MKKMYCYNRCSTCAKARNWLNQNNVTFEEIDIVGTPPTKEELLKLIKEGNYPLRYFFNTSGIHYRELGLKDKVSSMSAEEASELLANDGKLIKRPLMIEDNHFTCGFKVDVYEKEWL
ncbi:arsenate reductase family protein [Liquorilactobacillus cacaonum]|uniref:arsenate reductase family protein n=1 Tax=Liquorilactobacillus cacaonum TaxID=483012 RepID=UPI00070968D4|nr:arsenate reductase family protein [Liquorilactobacillus cacaonum]